MTNSLHQAALDRGPLFRLALIMPHGSHSGKPMQVSWF